MIARGTVFTIILAFGALSLASAPHGDTERFGDDGEKFTWPTHFPEKWPASWGHKPEHFPRSWPADRAWPSTWQDSWGTKPTAFPEGFPTGYGEFKGHKKRQADANVSGSGDTMKNGGTQGMSGQGANNISRREAETNMNGSGGKAKERRDTIKNAGTSGMSGNGGNELWRREAEAKKNPASFVGGAGEHDVGRHGPLKHGVEGWKRWPRDAGFVGEYGPNGLGGYGEKHSQKPDKKGSENIGGVGDSGRTKHGWKRGAGTESELKGRFMGRGEGKGQKPKSGGREKWGVKRA